MKKIPYAVSSYETIRQRDLYYIDKTPYIPLLEDMGYYLIFIRPRRFGKSSFLTMLESYYDLACANQFDELFQDTYIYDHPTPEKHRYLILKFDFSSVSPDPDEIKESFEGHIKNQLFLFSDKYQVLLGERCITHLDTITNAYKQLEFLLGYVGMKKQKIYVIIDEYDNFANTILATQGPSAYHQLTHGEGFLRHFFALLKSGAGQKRSGLERMFITGVSPVTMDDVTSGFNIGRNITLSPLLNTLLGFTTTDMQMMLDYYYEQGALSEEHRASVLPLMELWYNHYRFAEEASETLFNTTMVLYFMQRLLESGKYPKYLIDQNVRIDYVKLRHLMVLDRRLNGNFRQLSHILTDQETPPMQIAESFPVEHLTKPDNFLSLLYYFGLLSYTDHGTLQVPNETVKQILYSYIRNGYENVNVFTINVLEFQALMYRMAYAGEWQAVFAFLAREVERQTTIRDYLSGEKVVQTFLAVYLNMVDYYLTHTEQEMKKGFADMYMEPFWHAHPDVGYSYLIELKYIPRSEYREERLQAELAKAKAQVLHYATDEFVVKRNRGATLRCIALVFNGWELKAMEEA